MPTLELRLLSLLENIDGRFWYGRPFAFPAISSLRDHPEPVVESLTTLVKDEYEGEDTKLSLLYQHALPETPKVGSFALKLEAPRASKFWTAPLELTFKYMKWKHTDQAHLAYIPALNVQIVVPTAEKLDAALADQARFALGRFKALESLQQIIALQRSTEFVLHAQKITLNLPSPRQKLQRDEKDQPEKQILAEVGEDLGKTPSTEAYEIDTLVGLIADALASDPPRSVLLVGKSGVGKSAAVREVVRQRTRHGLGHTPFWGTSGSRLVAGTSGYGMWQERCQKLCRQAAHARAIVYVGNLMELLNVGKAEGLPQGVAGFLRPYIARGELLVLAECTSEQIQLIEREEPHLLSMLQRIDVSEPDAATGRRILEHKAELLGKQYDIALHASAFDKLDRLHRRYTTYSAFPGRPLRFLDNLVFAAPRGATLTDSDVAQAFSQETGLPPFLLDPALPLDIEASRAWFAERVLGQTQAIETVLDVLVTAKAGLARPRRPLASMLFIGPTGVGKTEMAKAIAEMFFSDRTRLSRFDMSEFAEGDALQRLVGSAARGEGVLTSRVREQPFSVILLDEVEKAHPLVFDLLLQVLGDARLTDSAGRLADFSNAIVILTSNLGAESFQLGRSGFNAVARSTVSIQQHFAQEVQKFFRPEFVNRLDHVIPFATLDSTHLRQIAAREMALVKRRDGLLLRRAVLNADDAVLDLLTEKGCDPRYGARPLKREIERRLIAPLAEKMNSYSADSLVNAGVSVRDGALSIQATARPDENSNNNQYVAGLSRLCSDVRRKVQRLQSSSAISEVRSDIWRLERLLSRPYKKGTIPRGAERLLPLQSIIKDVDALFEDIHRAEERVLLNVMGHTREALEMIQPIHAEAVRRLNEILLRLYALTFEKPDYLLIALYGEDRVTLFTLMETYHAIAVQYDIRVELHVVHLCHKKCGCGSALSCEPKEPRQNRVAIERLSEFFAQPDQWRDKALGYVLVLRGSLAAPRLLAEYGDHIFKLLNNTVRVRVDSSTTELKNLEIPEGLERRGALNPLPTRREYDLRVRRFTDSQLDKVFDWTGANLTSQMTDAIQQLLLRRMEGVLDS